MDICTPEKKRRGPKLKPLDPRQFVKNRPNRLREYRLKGGFSQEELAERLGVSRQTICIAERRGRGLGEDNWYKLACIFDIDPRILKGYSPSDFFSEKS